MRNALLTAVLGISLAGTPFLVGCDREVAHTEKTTTDSHGNATKSQETTVQHPDGSVSTEKSSSKSTNNNP